MTRMKRFDALGEIIAAGFLVIGGAFLVGLSTLL